MPRGFDSAALERAAEQEIAQGLAACQIAVARDGEVVWTRSFGNVGEETRCDQKGPAQ